MYRKMWAEKPARMNYDWIVLWSVNNTFRERSALYVSALSQACKFNDKYLLKIQYTWTTSNYKQNIIQIVIGQKREVWLAMAKFIVSNFKGRLFAGLIRIWLIVIRQ